MRPGWTSVTETGIPSDSVSIRSASVNPCAACLAAIYADWIGTDRSPKKLPTLTIAPASAIAAGAGVVTHRLQAPVDDPPVDRVHHSVHVLNRHVDQAAEDRHAGIVDPRVEAPETLDRG